MTEICSKCGLPSEICVCETIAKEDQNIKIIMDRKRFGKEATIIEGIDEKNINIKELAKELKTKFACGGTSKDGRVELQGNHITKVKEELVNLGFDPSQIIVEHYKKKPRK